MHRAILSFFLLISLTSATTQAASIVSGSGRSLITGTSTGVFQLNVITADNGARREILALMHQGTLVEVHTRALSSVQYLPRTATSTPIRKSTSTFDDLIAITGGINKNVNTMGSAKVQQFLTRAGLSGGSSSTSLPLSVPPVNGTCPQYYELNKLTKLCVLITQSTRPEEPHALAQALYGLVSWMVSPAHAMVDWIAVKFTLSTVFDFGSYEAKAATNITVNGQPAYRFTGFGLDIFWVDMPPGG